MALSYHNPRRRFIVMLIFSLNIMYLHFMSLFDFFDKLRVGLNLLSEELKIAIVHME